MSNPIANYSFRHSVYTDSDEEAKCGCTFEALINFIKGFCKAWSFQKEKSDNGYVHWQGNFSLIKKRRKTEILGLSPIKFMYLEPLHDRSTLYNLKEDTRIDGPWTDKDEELYIPRQYRNKVDRLYPYQQKIWDLSDVPDDRGINCLYDPLGCSGKSTIASLMEIYRRGIDLPPVNDYKELIQVACDICMAKQLRTPGTVFIDMPRAMNKERLNGIYTAIEQIKKGKLYDLRYQYKEWWIDSPQVWVFTNVEPDLSMLSRDRWRVWIIDADKQLKRFSPLMINGEEICKEKNGSEKARL